jgi:hypothetical protein
MIGTPEKRIIHHEHAASFLYFPLTAPEILENPSA